MDETYISTQVDSGSPTESVTVADQATDPTLVPETIDSSAGLLPYFEDLQTTDGSMSAEETGPVTAYQEETQVATVIDYSPVIYDIGNGIMASVLYGVFLIAGLLVVFKIMGGKPYGN